MGMVLDRQAIENAEKEQHNAGISDRFAQLFDTVAEQFGATEVRENQRETTTYTTPTRVSETPAMEHTPVVQEYAPSALAASVFSADKFEQIEGFRREEVVQTPTTQVVVRRSAVAQYTLTPLAKVAMAVFTLLVIAMLALIGVNSQILQRKSIQIKNLEQKKEQLMEENEEIQRYIRELQSEESIIQRATEAGLLG